MLDPGFGIFVQGVLDLFLKILVSHGQLLVHPYPDDLFLVGRESFRDVLEEDEGGRVHEVLAEQKGRCSGPAAHSHIGFGSAATTVVLRVDLADFFYGSVGLLKGALALGAPCETVAGHAGAIHPVKYPVDVVCIAAHDRPGHGDGLLRGAGKDGQSVALCGIPIQFVDLIGDGVVPPSLEVTADVVQRRHALELAAVRGPQGREHLGAADNAVSALGATGNDFAALGVAKVTAVQVLALAVEDTVAGVGIDESAHELAGFGELEDMLPVVGELASLAAQHKPGRFGTGLFPPLAAHAAQVGKPSRPPVANQMVALPLDFADPMGFAGIAAVAHVVDEEDARMRNAVEDFPGPLLDQVRGAHDETGVLLAVGVNVAGGK